MTAHIFTDEIIALRADHIRNNGSTLIRNQEAMSHTHFVSFLVRNLA